MTKTLSGMENVYRLLPTITTCFGVVAKLLSLITLQAVHMRKLRKVSFI